MVSARLLSELQISSIEKSKPFIRLSEKPQVLFTEQGKLEVTVNRLIHSYEVATSASIIALSIEDRNNWSHIHPVVDHQFSVRPCSLLHDIGHSAFAHPGSEFLDSYFKEKGLPEGFCDNNNSLVVIENNNIIVSDYTLASVIKYPDRLYPNQKEKYTAILEKSLNLDRQHFKDKVGIEFENLSRTIACQVMDEADRNTYICSDLSDFLCLGHTLPLAELKALANKLDVTYRFTELQSLFAVIKSKSKTTIRAYFNNLKNKFNMNYNLTSKGLVVVDHDLLAFREFLWEVEFNFYITPIRKGKLHLQNMERLKQYADKIVIDGERPSAFYSQIIEQGVIRDDRIAILRAQRDMIAEATDLYVVHKTEL